MELTFLGTAASEGYPDAFCRCRNCERARELGGPNLRLRSAAIIDRTLLLDFGPDVMGGSLKTGISLGDVRYCLLTHEHADHLEVSNFTSRSPHCRVEGAPCMTFFASAGALRAVGQAYGTNGADWLADSVHLPEHNLQLCVLEAGRSALVGPYRVTPIPAQHHLEQITPFLYAIERDGRSLFYATDTGPLPAEAWLTLRDWGGRFDAVVLDHTFGFAGRSDGHLNGEQFLETIEQLRDEGRLAANCRVFAHHLAHHSNPDHETLAAHARERGYEVAFDGLTVTV